MIEVNIFPDQILFLEYEEDVPTRASRIKFTEAEVSKIISVLLENKDIFDKFPAEIKVATDMIKLTEIE